ncbi:MAG: hypothetical protein ACREEM_05240 [Blastocatellia bacterium]
MLIHSVVAVLIRAVVRERTEHQEAREFVIAERRELAERGRIVKPHSARFFFFPAENLIDRSLVLGRDAVEELLDGFIEMRTIERPREGFDRFLHHALPHDFIHLDVKQLLLSVTAICRCWRAQASTVGIGLRVVDSAEMVLARPVAADPFHLSNLRPVSLDGLLSIFAADGLLLDQLILISADRA